MQTIVHSKEYINGIYNLHKRFPCFTSKIHYMHMNEFYNLQNKYIQNTIETTIASDISNYELLPYIDPRLTDQNSNNNPIPNLDRTMHWVFLYIGDVIHRYRVRHFLKLAKYNPELFRNDLSIKHAIYFKIYAISENNHHMLMLKSLPGIGLEDAVEMIRVYQYSK